jgi:hypothetical protein
MLKPNCHDAKQRMLKQKQAGCWKMSNEPTAKAKADAEGS